MAGIEPEKLKPFIAAIIGSIIMIVVGTVGVNMSYGIGNYVLQQLNTSISGGIGSPLVNPAQLSIIGTSLIIAGIVVLVVAVSVMIKALLGTTE